MENEKKYARTTPAQLRWYINFLRSHPELLQGKNCPTSPNLMKHLWQEIALNLNAMLGPTRTPDSWKETLRNCALETFGLAAVEGHSGVTLGFGILTNIQNTPQPTSESSLPPAPVCCTSATIAPNPYEVPNVDISATENSNPEVPETRRSTKPFREMVLELVQQDIKERKEEQARVAKSLQYIANAVVHIADAIKELVVLQRQHPST